MNKLFALALSCAVFMGVSSIAQTPDTSDLIYIYGSVYDAISLYRINGASVTIDNSIVARTVGESFYAGPLLPGRHTITVNFNGYWSSTADTVIKSSLPHLNCYIYDNKTDRHMQTMDMIEQGNKYGSIAGTITDALNHEVMPGVIVSLDNKIHLSRGAITSFDGKYYVPNLLPGDYDFDVRMMGYATQNIHCKVVAGQITYLNINLKEELLWGLDMGDRAWKPLIDLYQTGTVHKWTAEEINKLPGH